MLAPTEKPEIVVRPADISVKANTMQVKSVLQNVEVEKDKPNRPQITQHQTPSPWNRTPRPILHNEPRNKPQSVQNVEVGQNKPSRPQITQHQTPSPWNRTPRPILHNEPRNRPSSVSPSIFTTPRPFRQFTNTPVIWHQRQNSVTESPQQQTTPSKVVVPPKTWFNEKQKKPLEVSTKERNEEITPQIRPTYKPPVVHRPPPVFRGPTYNCRVLNPERDGRPNVNTDPTCNLKYPGFPADESCRCTYEVEDRDVNGCATGFLYTCSRV
uniref:Uncharacterized protein n=1 Tax=Acrobeloides nanus TaxID=290746 RepID=A0A914CL68_9BILA